MSDSLVFLSEFFLLADAYDYSALQDKLMTVNAAHIQRVEVAAATREFLAVEESAKQRSVVVSKNSMITDSGKSSELKIGEYQPQPLPQSAPVTMDDLLP